MTKEAHIKAQQEYIAELIAGTYFSEGEVCEDDLKKLIRQAKKELKNLQAMSEDALLARVSYENQRFHESNLPGGIL